MKNIISITLLILLALGFSACNDGADDTPASTTTKIPEPSTVPDSWIPSNETGTATSNPQSDGTTTSDNTNEDITSGSTGVLQQASAIPFPTMPTNIALDPKYIPPQ